VTNCNNIQPDIEALFPTFEDRSLKILAWDLAGGAVVVLMLLWFPNVRKGATVEVGLVFVALVSGALTCSYWKRIALFLTDNGEGEPIAMWEGVSVWPTVLLRILGVVLSVYFIWQAQRRLHTNLAKIAHEMRLPTDAAFRDRRTLWSKLKGVFDFSLGSTQRAQTLSLDVGETWREYVGQERFWLRLCRASFYTLLVFESANLILIPFLDAPIIPVRSDFGNRAYWGTQRLDVILMVFLNFFVFDATCFCLLFVQKIRRAQTTKWPTKTMERFEHRLGLQTDIVNDWMNLNHELRHLANLLPLCPGIFANSELQHDVRHTPRA
jgi:hypothetical protein